MRKLAVVVSLVLSFTFAASASAAIPSVFADNPYLDDGSPGGIVCTVQGPGSYAGQRWCGTGQHNANNGSRSTVESFDGVPIDINVAFPPAPNQGSDGPWPLMMMFHGYGGGKVNFTAMQEWLSRGYAVFAQTNRGFHESCGTVSSKAADPDCTPKGFVRLDDTRYEVRDAQEFAGQLVDQGLVDPDAIGATGGSYGGGMSMSLAALNDRMMMPDGSLVDWESPDGTSLSLALSLPLIPWTDLAYSLVPSGSNLDYVRDASYGNRFGVMKQGYVNGLYLAGRGAPGYYAPAGEQPSADLAGWLDLMNLGEPYEGNPATTALLDEVKTFHSSYYIDPSTPPSPILIASGFTDDLFPANEATRYYNRTRALYPNHPIGLFFGSFGHARGQNKPGDLAALATLNAAWADYYLGGTGPKPASEVTSYTQTCPNDAPSAGPYTAANWAASSPGEIRFRSPGTKVIDPSGGDPAIASLFKPTPTGSACATASGTPESGVANYDLPAAPAGGYTLLGSPTLVAKISFGGSSSQIAARLVDVSGDGSTKILISRGLFRPLGNSTYQVFQLFPNGWKVEEGHHLRLELLPADAAGAPATNYGRPSNDQAPVTVANLDLRLPVVEQPGSVGGLVTRPARKPLPTGARLAPGFGAIGSIPLAKYASGTPKVAPRARARGSRVGLEVTCPTDYLACSGRLVLKGASGPLKGRTLSSGALGRLSGGKSKTVTARLAGPAVDALSGGRKLKAAILVGGTRVGMVSIGG